MAETGSATSESQFGQSKFTVALRAAHSTILAQRPCSRRAGDRITVVLKVSFITSGEDGFTHAAFGADNESRTLTCGEVSQLAKSKLRKLDAEVFILSGVTPKEAGLPEAMCASADEIAFLATGKVDCTALEGIFRRAECDGAEAWQVQGGEGECPVDILSAAGAVAGLWTLLESISDRLRAAIERIASETGFPTALITISESESILGETAYHPADVRADLPARAKMRADTALDALKSLPRMEEVFRKLREKEYAGMGYEYRPEQEQFAKAVSEALECDGHLLIEAGTGVGKSLGYLIPATRHALASGETVLVSTNTKILQDQLLLSDYPKLCELLNYHLPPPVVLKGRENYLCLEKLRLQVLGTRTDLRETLGELREIGEGHAVALTLMRLAIHIATETSGDYEHVMFPAQLPADTAQRIKRMFSAAFRGCLRDRCPMHNQCYFYSQREAAEKSLLVIVNHALLFALAIPGVNPADQMASFVDKAQVWVLDEAHNLEEVLLDQMGVALISGDIIEFINGLQRLAQGRALGMRLGMPVSEVPTDDQEAFGKLKALQTEVPGYAERCYESFRSLTAIAESAFQRLADDRGGDTQRWDFTEPTREEVAEVKEEMAEAITTFYDYLIDMSGGMTLLAEQTAGNADNFLYIDDSRYQIQLRDAINVFVSLKEACKRLLGDEETWVKWMEVTRSGRRRDVFWMMAACPVVVGTHFQELISARKSALMVSGTLAINGKFGYVKRCLGLEAMDAAQMKEVILSSPFDFKRNALVIIPSDMPEPSFNDRAAHEHYLEALAELTADAVRVFGGSTLVLFNSYADLQKVSDMCTELCDDGFKLLIQERGISKHQLVDDFKSMEKAVLFGMRSFWEGFDIKGDDLQCVIISRFPFPNLHDPLTAGKARYIDRHGGSSFTDYMLPYAIMKFTQGFGRLIRSTDDYGCVLLLDGRVLTKRYGLDFLRNLPGPTIVKLPRHDVADEMQTFLSNRRRDA